jgi:hypothetical protein
MSQLDLDVDVPEKVPVALRRAVEHFEEAFSELQSAWQDRNAGRVWHEFAKILDRAADSCDRAIDKHV